MPFQPGQSGNPGGQRKTRRQWIKEQERFREAKASWEKLLKLRDEMVLERKTIPGPGGEPIEVDVVPSVRELIACCKEILNRAVGLPKQEVEVTGEDGKPFAWKLVLQGSENHNGNGTGTNGGAPGISFHFGGSDGKS